MSTAASDSILFFGTYDLDKPRVRILIKAAQNAGLRVTQCHHAIWNGIEDKAVTSKWKLLARMLRGMAAYPQLVLQYLRTPAHGTVMLCYPAYLDLLVIWPLARIRGDRIIWDVFVSTYETLCEDRKMLSTRSPAAWLLYGLEWITYRMADTLFMDTKEHARYLEERFRLRKDSVGHVWVGAEQEHFHNDNTRTASSPSGTLQVLFYGQYIPLHGIGTILDAVHLLSAAKAPVTFTLIGEGQEASRIEQLLRERPADNVSRLQWLPYAQLSDAIHKADICLGIFGTSRKAACVIPNKVYQILACRRPLVTLDSPAVRELLAESEAVRLVPAGNAQALAHAILEICQTDPQALHLALEKMPVVTYATIASQLRHILEMPHA